MNAIVIIPARYASTRFPGKPLALLRGKPMIQHVYEQARRAREIDEVIVATDDARIAQLIRGLKGTVVMTNPAAQSGTERVAEVARNRKAKVVINVQGDEPLIHPEMVDQLAHYLNEHQAVPMASLMCPLQNESEGSNPNVVKVVVDNSGFAMYFSRNPIPHVRNVAQKPMPRFYKHIGLYGYQRAFLLQFSSLDKTTLEDLEQLEQLRALEHGYRIKLLETAHDTIAIDTPEDLQRAETYLAKVTV